MKTKILELLKTKFVGVQDSVLSRIADKLAKTATTDEAVTTAIEGVTIQTVIDSYADSRANEATNTAVVNYEKKHSIKDGKAVVIPAEPQPTPGEVIPAWAQTVLEQNKTLAAQIAAFQTGKQTDTRRTTFEQKLTDAKAPTAFKTQMLNTVDKMTLTDEEFEAFTGEAITNAGLIVQETSNAGLGQQHQPFVAFTGGGATAVATDIKDWADKKTPPAAK